MRDDTRSVMGCCTWPPLPRFYPQRQARRCFRFPGTVTPEVRSEISLQVTSFKFNAKRTSHGVICPLLYIALVVWCRAVAEAMNIVPRKSCLICRHFNLERKRIGENLAQRTPNSHFPLPSPISRQVGGGENVVCVPHPNSARKYRCSPPLANPASRQPGPKTCGLWRLGIGAI